MPGYVVWIDRIQQTTPNLCWWASAQMLAQYRRRKITNASVVARANDNVRMHTDGSFLEPAGFRRVPKSELPPGPDRSRILTVRNMAWGSQVDPKVFGEKLCSCLRRYGPLLTLISWSGGKGVPEHALVVRGTDAEKVAQICDPARVWREPWTLQSLAKVIAYTCATPMMYLP